VWIERRPRRVSASILAAAPTSFEAERLPNSAPPAAFLRTRTAEAIIPGGYLVKDGDGVTLAYVYGKAPDRISASQL